MCIHTHHYVRLSLQSYVRSEKVENIDKSVYADLYVTTYHMYYMYSTE